VSATLLGGDIYDAIWAEREHLALGLAVGLLQGTVGVGGGVLVGLLALFTHVILQQPKHVLGLALFTHVILQQPKHVVELTTASMVHVL
jgi:hypothetical protein